MPVIVWMLIIATMNGGLIARNEHYKTELECRQAGNAAMSTKPNASFICVQGIPK